MKDVFKRVFLILCSLIFICEAAVLLLLYLGGMSVDNFAGQFKVMVGPDRGVTAALFLSCVFLVIALAFLVKLWRSFKRPQTIIFNDGREIIRIPIETVKDFVDQVLEKKTFLQEFKTWVVQKGKKIVVDVLFVPSAPGSVHAKVRGLRLMLKEKIDEVFELPECVINFHVGGIKVEEGTVLGSDANSKYDDDEEDIPFDDLILSDQDEVNAGGQSGEKPRKM